MKAEEFRIAIGQMFKLSDNKTQRSAFMYALDCCKEEQLDYIFQYLKAIN